MLDAALIRESLRGPHPVPELGSAIDASRAKPAGVVVPLRLAPDPHALLVLRASHLKDHAGEVGFPGGKPDAADASLEATALRELDEELGVPPGEVEIVGRLVPTPVITGRYMIHPFVGLLSPRAAPRPNATETARLLVLPLLPLIHGEQRIKAVKGDWNGVHVFAPHFEVDGAVLYGASAYIFYELLLRLAAKLGRTLPPPEVTAIMPWGDRYDR